MDRDEIEDRRALVEQARRGEKKALEALLGELSPRVYRYGVKMCGEEQDAQEVLQETLLATARGLHDLREPDALLPWAYKIARSFCSKKRRRSRFAPPAEASLEQETGEKGRQPADPAKTPEEAYASRQLAGALQRAVDALRPDQREVLLLRDVDGLTAPEISKVLGVGVRAVKSRLHRARASVRRQLGPLLGVEEPAAPEQIAERCPDIVRIFSRHLEGELRPADCRKMERHLAACEQCRARCELLKKTLALCAESSAEVSEVTKNAVKKALRAYLKKGGGSS